MIQPSGREQILCSDPRVSMAAERTVLAWARTGIAMMGLGFVLARFGLFLPKIDPVDYHGPPYASSLSLWLGAALIVLGVTVNVLVACNHVRFMTRLKRGDVREPAILSLGVVVTLLLSVVGIALAIYLITEGV